MRIVRNNVDDGHYVAHLRSAGAALNWDQVGCTHVLLVRGPFGREIDFDHDVLPALQSLDGQDKEGLLDGSPVESSIGLHVRLLHDGSMTGTPVPHSRYAAYGCVVDGDSLTIYVTDGQSAYGSQRDIPAQVQVRRGRVMETVSGGFLGLRKTERLVGFSMQVSNIAGYEGGLRYRLPGVEWTYPITQRMLGNQWFVPVAGGTSAPPEVIGDKRGYDITTVG